MLGGQGGRHMPEIAEKPYKHVNRISDEHVQKFVDVFRKKLNRTPTIMGEATEASGIMSWPDDVPAEVLDDQDEIQDRVLDRIEPALREAFRQSAEEVLGLRRRS
jgi:hypothetical protein